MATMWQVIIKNAGLVDVMIADLGISIPASSQITLSDQFTYSEIANSDDLRDLLSAATLVFNNGVRDLSILEAVGEVKQAHHNNPYGVDLFSVARYMVLGIGTAAARDLLVPNPELRYHNAWVNTETNKYNYYLNGAWVVAEDITLGDRVIDLSQAHQDVMRYGNDGWVSVGDPSAASNSTVAVLVADRYDNAESMYSYDIDNFSWRKNNPQDLQAAYEEGNTIKIDNTHGPVIIDNSSSTSPPINFINSATFPTTNLLNGSMFIKDGTPYLYDTTRAKWLSFDRDSLIFGRNGNSRNQFLNIQAGSVPSNNSGVRIEEKSCIVSLSGNLEAAVPAGKSCVLEVRKNDGALITSITIAPASLGNIDLTTDIVVSAGDVIQAYISSDFNANTPILKIKLAKTN
jgi:hypothetical protein